jgi:hypothetical protein
VDAGHPYLIHKFIEELGDEWWSDCTHTDKETECTHHYLLDELKRMEKEKEEDDHGAYYYEFCNLVTDCVGWDEGGEDIRKYNPAKMAYLLKHQPAILDWCTDDPYNVVQRTIMEWDVGNLETIVGMLEAKGESLHVRTALNGMREPIGSLADLIKTFMTEHPNRTLTPLPEAVQRHLDRVV